MSGKKAVKYFSIKLSDKEVRRIKIFCAKESMTLKSWYKKAFQQFIDARAELDRRGEKRLYRARPARAQQVSVGTDREVVSRVKSWAEADNVRFAAAYYTAVVEYLEQCEKSGENK